ncbi:MAG: hypothetical protein RL693_1037 [Verrucomicrobiota bacterium]|jgi:hypothetical protein
MSVVTPGTTLYFLLMNLRISPSLLLAALVATSALNAASPLEPQAEKIVQAMCQTLSSAKSLEVAGSRRVDEGFFEGSPGDTSSTFIASVLRPGYIRSTVEGKMPLDIVSDGVNLSWFAPSDNAYGVLKSAATIDGAIDILKSRTSMSFPVAELLANDVLTRGLKNVTSGKVVGTEKVGGATCDRVRLEMKTSAVELVIDQKSHLPQQLVVIAKDLKGEPRFQVDFKKWDLNAKLTPADFVFRAPAGADKLDPP